MVITRQMFFDKGVTQLVKVGFVDSTMQSPKDTSIEQVTRPIMLHEMMGMLEPGTTKLAQKMQEAYDRADVLPLGRQLYAVADDHGLNLDVIKEHISVLDTCKVKEGTNRLGEQIHDPND